MKKYLALIAAVATLVTMKVQAMPREGFYVGGLGGANFVQTSKNHHHEDLKFKTGYAAGAFIGYEWCSGLRLEAEATYRHNQIKCGDSEDFCFRKGHLTSWCYMANLLYDIDLSCWTCGCYDITPYLGGGVGYSHARIRRGHFHFDDEDGFDRNGKSNGFAWQLIAGLGFEIWPCTDLAVEYRFFRGHAHRVYNHTVDLALRYHF